MKKITAAGIIIFRNENNIPVFLGLKALKKFRKISNGTYDIPKGRMDPGELPFETAKRECFEESGLTPSRIIAGPFIDGPLAVWLAETATEEIILAQNPETNEIQHEDYKWLKPEQLRKTCLDYLKPSIVWAEEKVWEYLKI